VVIAVAHHQPVTVLVALVGELLDISADPGPQCRGQHLPGAVADDLVEQRPMRAPSWALASSVW
jgi:hypothetical protein